ncbi:hypothetical protein MMC18_009294 [Xylographa bjoerkii]|nr:hypothetical protein [Xylographa bjoerkii]
MSEDQQLLSRIADLSAPISNSAIDSFSPLPNAEKDVALNEGETVEGRPRATATWISKRDRHMQLINSSIYDKETNLRQQAIDKTRHERALQRNQREMLKIGKHFQSIGDNTVPVPVPHSLRGETAVYEVNINGLRFQVLNGGSKLSRDQGSYEFITRILV